MARARAATLAALGVLVASSGRAAAQEAGDLVIETRKTFDRQAQDLTYEVGTLYVPERRDDELSRVIGVGFARFRALEQPPSAPPIFLLPGGPGNSYVSRLENAGASERSRQAARYQMFTRVSDLVLVDQRGCSERGDVLQVTYEFPAQPLDQPSSLETSVEQYVEYARFAVSQLEDEGVDLSGYTVKECARDVNDLREALGYEQVTLVGTSFGSQWSFAVMRLHPEIVARALLSGVEPLDHGYDMPSYVFAAVQRMWHHLEQESPELQPFLPDGGIAAAALAVMERLELEPLVVQEAGSDGGGIVLGPEDFPWSDPAQILALYHGDLENAARLRDQGGGTRTVPLLGVLIDSSLGVTPERRHRLWSDPATRYIGRGNFARYLATAELWPSPDVGDDFRTPVLCDIPVVFAQGDWDTSTPIENTYEIAPYFPSSRVLVAERGGHGVLEDIAGELPEVWETLEDFLRTGETDAIPARVRLKPSRVFPLPSFVPEAASGRRVRIEHRQGQ